MNQKALRVVNAHHAQTLQHGWVVHELGNGANAHDLGHIGEAAHRGFVERVVNEGPNELAVDLEVVHRQGLEVAERGRAGTKVVERHAHANGTHLFDEHGRISQAGHGCRLGDFKTQPGTDCSAGLRQLLHRPAVECAVSHRLPRQVDAEVLDRVEVRHAGEPFNGLGEHPAVDVRGQVEAFGGGQESTRRNERAVGIAHSHQHFGVHTTLRRVHRLYALGEQDETVFVQCLADARGPLHFAVSRAHRLVGVEPGVHAVAAGFLGGITRCIGRLHDGRGVVPAPVHRHQADAGADAEAPPIVHEAEFIHAVADLLRHALRLRHRAMFEDDGKFVAAQPSQRIARTHRVAEQFADLLQQLVPHGVATGVVDQLELVQVDVQQCVFAVFLERLVQSPAQTHFEFGAVHQAGQGVVRGAVAHLAGQSPLLGHVVEHQHHTQ